MSSKSETSRLSSTQSSNNLLVGNEFTTLKTLNCINPSLEVFKSFWGKLIIYFLIPLTTITILLISTSLLIPRISETLGLITIVTIPFLIYAIVIYYYHGGTLSLTKSGIYLPLNYKYGTYYDAQGINEIYLHKYNKDDEKEPQPQQIIIFGNNSFNFINLWSFKKKDADQITCCLEKIAKSYSKEINKSGILSVELYTVLAEYLKKYNFKVEVAGLMIVIAPMSVFFLMAMIVTSSSRYISPDIIQYIGVLMLYFTTIIPVFIIANKKFQKVIHLKKLVEQIKTK